MGKKTTVVRVRQRAAKNTSKNFKTHWTVVRQTYVTSTMGLRELAQRFGIPFRTVAERSRKDGWAAARAKEQIHLATKLQQELSEDALTYRVRAAKAIRGVKEVALANLLKRVNQGLLLTTKDLEILQRLEMDLLEPGWTKSEAEQKQGGNVNMFIGLETTVLEALEERRLLDVTGSSKVIGGEGQADDLTDTRPDQAVTSFLYGNGTEAEVPTQED